MTALLEYLDLLHDFLLAIFDAILLEFSCDTARKKCEFLRNYSQRSPYYSGIIPDSSTTYYSKNYSGIMYACLAICSAMHADRINIISILESLPFIVRNLLLIRF